MSKPAIHPEILMFIKHTIPLPKLHLPTITSPINDKVIDITNFTYMFLPKLNNDLIVFIPDSIYVLHEHHADELSENILQYVYWGLGEYAYRKIGQFSVMQMSRISCDYAVRPFNQLIANLQKILIHGDHCALCNISEHNANLSKVAYKHDVDLIFRIAPQISTLCAVKAQKHVQTACVTRDQVMAEMSNMLYCSYCSILLS